MKRFTQENYPQLLAYREEGLRKVGARFVDQLEAPRARTFFPTVWSAGRPTACRTVRIGPLQVAAIGASMIMAGELLGTRRHARILDIGCSRGQFRDYLRTQHPALQLDYIGMDIAPPAVDFPVYADMGNIEERDFDLVFMSEVAEHMPADEFAGGYLARFPALLKPDGLAVIGVPNPLTPSILWRDITHVQHYPWFDLYAMLRFFFNDVDVTRTRFIHTPRRLLSYPLQRALAFLLEHDWCEGLTVVARTPVAPFVK